MAVSGGATTAYKFKPTYQAPGVLVVEQHHTTSLASNCVSIDVAIALIEAGKPATVQGSDSFNLLTRLHAAGIPVVQR